MTIEEIGAFCNAMYMITFLGLMGYTLGDTRGTDARVTVFCAVTGTVIDK